MPKVKICGVTNAQDALWAANLGADFLGLNFCPQSPRKVSLQHAKELAAQIPPFVGLAGVFVDEPMESLAKTVKRVPLKIIQLHGMESPEYCRDARALGVKLIKALRLQKPLELAELTPYEEHVDYFLFDTYSVDMPGGTGLSFSWDWLKALELYSKPWFLAGGLHPGNILEALKAVHPPMVDVCSGVEKSQTRKDYEAMKNFIQIAKSVR